MLLRLLTGAGLLALGYYVGKQVGQMAPIREDLKRLRDSDGAGDADPEARPPVDDTGH
jgi:hypothetical protein